MEASKNKSITFKLLTSLVIIFVIIVTMLWFFKEDIDLAVVPESKAGTELNISSVTAETNYDDMLPAQRYAQSLLDNPDNFDTSEFEDMLPAQAMMHSEDMFLVGF